AETIVQAHGAPLPELDFLRFHADATPEFGQRYLAVHIAFANAIQAIDQRVATGDRLALPRGPGRQLAVTRAAGEVARRFGRREVLRLAPDLDLTFQEVPGKE